MRGCKSSDGCFYLQGLKLEALPRGRIVFKSLLLINRPNKPTADLSQSFSVMER